MQLVKWITNSTIIDYYWKILAKYKDGDRRESITHLIAAHDGGNCVNNLLELVASLYWNTFTHPSRETETADICEADDKNKC